MHIGQSTAIQQALMEMMDQTEKALQEIMELC